MILAKVNGKWAWTRNGVEMAGLECSQITAEGAEAATLVALGLVRPDGTALTLGEAVKFVMELAEQTKGNHNCTDTSCIHYRAAQVFYLTRTSKAERGEGAELR